MGLRPLQIRANGFDNNCITESNLKPALSLYYSTVTRVGYIRDVLSPLAHRTIAIFELDLPFDPRI